MSDSIKIRRALISVYDKTGIVDFARALHDEFGIEIISTGGTAKTLTDAGIPVTLVENVTGFPEMMDGRVKTLHPKIHAAILADRDNPEHMRQLKEQGIEPIDMVVVNLYPFEKTIAKPDCTFEEAIEMIDIGGPCLLRAAAKNHQYVWVVSEVERYAETLGWLRHASPPPDSMPDRHAENAAATFAETSMYDADVTEWMGRKLVPEELYPWVQALFHRNWGKLRYGENPHQVGQLLETFSDAEFCLPTADAAYDSPTELSFNNYADASAALELCAELTRASSGGPGGLKSAALHKERGPGNEEPGASTPPVSPCEKLSTPSDAASPNEEPRASARPVLRPEQASTCAAVFQEPDCASPAWLLSWTTYGSWLPGDKRGFVSRRPGASGGSVINNVPERPYDADQQDVEEAARKRMKGAPIALGPDEAQAAFDAFVEAAISHHVAIIAVSIMPDHVHLLCQGEQDGAELLRLLKGVSSRRMSQKCELANAPRWWTESGSRRYIQKGDDLLPAIEYVRNQKESLRAAWFGDFGAIKTGRDRETGRAEARGSSLRSDACAVCFIKHTNACGAAVEADSVEAYRKAYLGDPNAAMGGILAVNFNVNAEFAQAVMETYQRWGKPAGGSGFFVEVWLAPAFDQEAVRIIRGDVEGKPQKAWGKRVRLLDVGDMSIEPDPSEMDFKRIAGGVLMQNRDLVGLNEEQWKVITEREPTNAELDDLRLAWIICKHTKSNAITVCKDGMLLGNGAGQMSRVMSCRIATWLAKDNGHDEKLKGAVAASDAFFPFRDGPDLLADAGVTAIIQPGGSKRDQEVIAACNERSIAMIFTGTRHFKH